MAPKVQHRVGPSAFCIVYALILLLYSETPVENILLSHETSSVCVQKFVSDSKPVYVLIAWFLMCSCRLQIAAAQHFI
jgi:hypothetical protein